MLTVACLNIERELLWFNVLLALMIWKSDEMSKPLIIYHRSKKKEFEKFQGDLAE